MKENKKIFYGILVAIVIALIVISIIIKNNSKKVYEGGGLTITITGNKKVTVIANGEILAQDAELVEIPTPEGTENPEKYSRFIKVNINGDIIAGFSKDKKTLYVSNIEYKLVED